jgi:hypothetical protein
MKPADAADPVASHPQPRPLCTATHPSQRSSTRCTGSCSPSAATSSSRPRNWNGRATGAHCRVDWLGQLETPTCRALSRPTAMRGQPLPTARPITASVLTVAASAPPDSHATIQASSMSLSATAERSQSTPCERRCEPTDPSPAAEAQSRGRTASAVAMVGAWSRASSSRAACCAPTRSPLRARCWVSRCSAVVSMVGGAVPGRAARSNSNSRFMIGP